MEPDRLQKRYRNKRSTLSSFADKVQRSKRGIPHIIYPEILVIVDYDGYRLHGGDNTQVKTLKPLGHNVQIFMEHTYEYLIVAIFSD